MNRHAVTSREPEQLRRVRALADGDARRYRTASWIPRDRGGRAVAENQHGRAVERWPSERRAFAGPPRIRSGESVVLALLGWRHRERVRDLDVPRDGVDHAECEPRDRERGDGAR